MKRTAALERRTRLKKLGAARRRKFGNTPRTYNGIEYHSQAEARYAAELDLRKRAIGVDGIAGWVRQFPVPLEVNGVLVCTYIVDFVVTHLDGREELIEIKGFETPEWRIKEKLFRALYPDIKLTVVRA